MKIPCGKWSKPADWENVDWDLPTTVLVKEVGGSRFRVDYWRRKVGHAPTVGLYQRRNLANCQIGADKRRSLFMKALQDGYTQSELAEIFGISRQCVNQIVNNGKRKSRAKADYATTIGLLVPAERCQKCNRKIKTTKHHHDYTKPLDVQWLCWPCHRKVHLNNIH